MSKLSNRGQSLIEITIAIGIMSILTLTFTTLVSTQQKETKAINEKLATLDLLRMLQVSLSDGSVCLNVLNTPTPLTFNANAVGGTNPVIIEIPPDRPIKTKVGGIAVATQGTLASNFTPSVKILNPGGIQLRITSGTGTEYIGSFMVNFDSASLVRPLKPLSIATTLTADISNPSAARITGCQGYGSTACVEVIVNNTYAGNQGMKVCPAGMNMVGFQEQGLNTGDKHWYGRMRCCPK